MPTTAQSHAPNKVNADQTAVNRPATKSADAPADKPLPNLTFTAPRVQLDTQPDAGEPPPAGTLGNANLTSHINDAAMRRAPPRSPSPEAVGGSHSGISPLARDGVTPVEEDERRALDARAADERARLKGMEPREDVAAWHQAEENRQSDLPGSPRRDLPE